MNDAASIHDGGSSAAPYGPATSSIRRFLVGLAALDAGGREGAVERFTASSGSRAFAVADAALADTIEKSGRGEAQDALAGPLLQLVRRRQAERVAGQDDAADDEDDAALDAIAEPALAALLALLVRDLLPAAHFRTLYGPFDRAIPVETLD